MAQYQFGENENVTESMQAILALAGDERAGEVQYQPGVGPAGAVNLPDDLHGEWTQVKADHDAEQDKKSKQAAADKESSGDESTDEADSKPAARASRRGAAKE